MPNAIDNPTPVPLPREVLATIAQALAAFSAAMPTARVAPELMTPEETAEFLGIAKSSMNDLASRGFLPESRRLGDGRLVRWSKTELLAWIAEGCPPRAKWNVLKSAGGTRKSA